MFVMDRKELIFFYYTEIFPQVDVSVGQYLNIGDVIKMIGRWRIGKKKNIWMTAKVDDGFLYINNDPVGRIAPKLPKVAYSDEAAYWEGRILSRQGD